MVSDIKPSFTEQEADEWRAEATRSPFIEIPSVRLLALLEENQDLRAEVEYFDGGYCDCGRQAEYCRPCAGGEGIAHG